MKYNEIKAATDPAAEALWNQLSESEKLCLQGEGAGFDKETGKVYILLSFLDTLDGSEIAAKKWHNQSIQGIVIRAEVRPAARF